MTRIVHPSPARKTALVLALIAAFGPALADDEPKVESRIEGQVSLGAGASTGAAADRALSGQYNGLRRDEALGLFGFDVTSLNGASGATLRLHGSNLGLDNREVGALYRLPGTFKLRLDYSELVRHDPTTIRSGIVDAGSVAPFVNAVTPGTGNDYSLRIKRTDYGLAFTQEIGTSLQLDLGVKTGQREGARLFGIGFNCPSPVAPGCGPTTGVQLGWATLMLPEPINSQTTQVEARLSYGGEKLSLSGGYYGSFYRNIATVLTPQVPGTLNTMTGTPLPLAFPLQQILRQEVALPPDNQAHEVDLSGVYAFTPATRLSFKVGYGEARQEQRFVAGGFTVLPAGATNLGGDITTTTVQLGLASRPVPKLSLSADVRYRERDDDTPIAAYNAEGTNVYTNRQLPNTRWNGKVQAGWQFTSDWRGALAATYEHIDRGVFTSTSAIAGTSALRQRTEETGVRAEVRRRMAEEFSAAVSLESSSRVGSNWLKDNSGLGVTEVTNNADPTFATAIFMPTLADRRRDTAKLRADWQPTDDLLVQAAGEAGRDRYSTPSAYGVRSTRVGFYSVDMDWAINATWRLTGNVGYGKQKLLQSKPGETVLSYDNTTTSFGAGLTGKLFGKLRVGGDIAYINDVSRYAQALDPAGASGAAAALLAATGGLPDITFRQTRVTLFGQVDVDKSSDVRLNVIYQQSRWNDWTWSYNDVPFVYADGSTVTMKPVQEAAFVGVVYTYRWK